MLIADNGRLFGIATPAGRMLSAAEGNGFAAESWLEDDGDLAGQAAAYARGGLERRRHRIEAEVPGLGRLVYVGSRDAAGAERRVRGGGGADRAELGRARPTAACLFVGRERLRARRGAGDPDHRRRRSAVEGARARPGRPWSGNRRRSAPPMRVAGACGGASSHACERRVSL